MYKINVIQIQGHEGKNKIKEKLSEGKSLIQATYISVVRKWVSGLFCHIL